MPDPTSTRRLTSRLTLAVVLVALLLTHCTTPKTTIRSTVASDLERPIPSVFIAVEDVDRSYLNVSTLKLRLVNVFQNAGLETEEVTFDPLTFDEQPGITGARDASLPYALVVTFEGGKVSAKVDGVPMSTSFEVDASLYDAETEERVWRGVLDAVESGETESDLSNRIIGALREDGVIPATANTASDSESLQSE